MSVDFGTTDIGNTPIPVTDNGGSLTVDGSVAVTGNVEITNDAGNPIPVNGTVTANVGTTNGLALNADLQALILTPGATNLGQKGSLTLGAVSTAAPAYTNNTLNNISLTPIGNVRVDGSSVIQPTVNTPSIYATYGAQILSLVPAAATTDFFTITGSATRTVIITKIRIGATTTLGSTKDVILVKRSTANTLGTSTTPVVVPFDSNDIAGTAVVRAYTANPTLGTLVGAFKAYKFQISAVGTANQDLQIEFNPFETRGITLRGTSQVLAINGNGVAFGGGASVDISIEWLEF